MAGDIAPQIILGSVYFEEATGDDSQPDVIQVSFEGGAAGTTLDRLVINGDKQLAGQLGHGLSEGDVIFDIAAGGLGAFKSVGLSIVSHDGFTIDTFSVVDGGSQIVFTFSGFDAGEQFLFSVDADEVQFIEPGAVSNGQLVNTAGVDVNPLVEGAEFQRSIMTGEFSAAHHLDLTLSGVFWDEFDSNFSAAESTTGLALDLPNDAYSPTHDFTDRTAGAVAYAAQIPLATISGWVYHDRSDDGIRDVGVEEGIGGVTVELLKDGSPTGITTTTSTNPNTLGYYEFIDLLPGNYGVREFQPNGWLDGKDTPGSHGGVAADESAGRVDRITGAVLDYGDDGINYNFGELLPGSIRGRVHADTGEDCDFDDPEILLEGVRIDLLDGDSNVVATTLTNENGEYEFTNLATGTYVVREHQPSEYYDGGERVGSEGGTASDVGNTYSIIAGIQIDSGVDAYNYDFCEKVGVMLSGNVYHDRSNDGIFDRPTEEGIGNVVVKLLSVDSNGQLVDTNLRTTTNSAGFYKFNNLAAGKYAVMEIHPAGWLDGIDTPGNLGGIADLSIGGDMISMIMINWGEMGTEYNFGELLPGSIAGRVHADTGEDCDFDDPDILLEGVKIELRDAGGNVVATTTTDADGRYHFDNLRPGEYQVREIQPVNYYDGGERVGTAGGTNLVNDEIRQIKIGSGVDAFNYDFCEKVGVMLSGNVYHDRSNDGIFDRPTEEGIGNVVVKLLSLDSSGQLVDTNLRATTDAAGFYKFNNLAAGKYAVMEIHPTGWLDGIDTPGNLGGIADPSPGGDMISMIMINWGEMGTEYNFGELLPGSIRGQVVVSTDPDCDPDDGEPPIADVRIDLLNASGQVVATTHTDANGEYEFTDLRPGTYTVREYQPDGYFDLDSHVGDGGGIHVSTNELGSIPIGSDQHLTNYDFCEEPPAELSGYVFIDGDPIVTAESLTPEQIGVLRDGQHTADDTPLPGIELKLVDTFTGEAIHSTSSIVLPGAYPFGPITTITDANGFYHFGGLRSGTYAVVEVQPTDLIDGIDTAGMHDGPVLPGDRNHGYPVNPTIGSGGPAVPAQFAGTIESLRQQFGYNAIVLVPLPAGEHSHDNDFSEVRVTPPPIFAPPPELPPPPEPPLILAPTLPFVTQPLFLPITTPKPPETFGGSSALGFTWHLSVINAGQPRSARIWDSPYQFVSAEADAANWQNATLDAAHWTLARLEGGNVSIQREEVFGNGNALPVSGDFNGDGVSDIGIYDAGRWFLDLNGNGHWDEGDLWARLGTEADRPVTGDWDDDGKADIGIYGPAWPRDPWAIANEPGVPDAENHPTQPADKAKNMPPVREEATSGNRLMKRTAQGKPRADLIDHVFHFGTPGDIPIAGDWNGDAIRAIGVFRDGQWNLDLDGDGRFTDVDAAFKFGQAGDLPVIGDFNGDGVDEVGIYRDGHWILDINGNRQIDAYDTVFELGGDGELPIVGDWDGDGIDDPGTYHPMEPVDRTAQRAG